MPRLAIASALLTPFLLLGCPPDADTETTVVTTDDADAYDDAEANDHGGHTALHGGAMLQVGEHEYSLEMVPGDGVVTVYVMDAHHEKPVAIAAEDIELEIDKEDGEEVELEGEAVDADGDGKASQYVFTVPEGMTILEAHDDHFDYPTPGHMHITLDGKEYEVMLGGDGHGHDHDDHDGDDHDSKMKAEGGSLEAGSGSPVLIEAGSN